MQSSYDRLNRHLDFEVIAAPWRRAREDAARDPRLAWIADQMRPHVGLHLWLLRAQARASRAIFRRAARGVVS